jgi:ribosome-associated translation inhibitor RaiA
MKKITFRHMEATADIENYANAALERVMDALKHERSPIQVDLVLTPGRPHAHHEVELLIKTPNHNVICKEEGPHFYQILDKACDLAYRKIHEQKKELLGEQRNKDKYKGT